MAQAYGHFPSERPSFRERPTGFLHVPDNQLAQHGVCAGKRGCVFQSSCYPRLQRIVIATGNSQFRARARYEDDVKGTSIKDLLFWACTTRRGHTRQFSTRRFWESHGQEPGDCLSRYRFVARTCGDLGGIQIRVRMCSRPRRLMLPQPTPRRRPRRRRGAPPAGGYAARPAPAPRFPPPQAAGSGPGPS